MSVNSAAPLVSRPAPSLPASQQSAHRRRWRQLCVRQCHSRSFQSHKGLFHRGRWFAKDQSVGPRGQAHASPLMRLLLAHTAAPWRPAPAATRPLTPAAVGPCQQGLAGRWNTGLGKSHTDSPGQCLSVSGSLPSPVPLSLQTRKALHAGHSRSGGPHTGRGRQCRSAPDQDALMSKVLSLRPSYR